MSSGVLLRSRSVRKSCRFTHRNFNNRRKFLDEKKPENSKKKFHSLNFRNSARGSRNRGRFVRSRGAITRQSTTLKMESNGDRGVSWFWQNYNIAMDWKQRHQTAFWKSRCEVLEAENKHLYECIEQLQKNNRSFCSDDTLIPEKEETERAAPTVPSKNLRPQAPQRTVTIKEEPEQLETEVMEEEEEEEFIFQVNEEMLAFLEHSAKHKLELKMQREAESKKEEDEQADAAKKLQFPKRTLQQRRDEMAYLYGPAAPMILSMETAMELSFDRFNDKYHAKLWPNIPLNL